MHAKFRLPSHLQGGRSPVKRALLVYGFLALVIIAVLGLIISQVGNCKVAVFGMHKASDSCL